MGLAWTTVEIFVTPWVAQPNFLVCKNIHYCMYGFSSPSFYHEGLVARLPYLKSSATLLSSKPKKKFQAKIKHYFDN